MKDIRKLTYRDFYYISLDEFYPYAIDIMKNLNYVFHRRIKDTYTRRAEIWKLFDSEEYKVLVWVEILEPSLQLTWQESADILRLMNDENIIRLFLFTNGSLDEAAKDILDDENHFLYTPRQIIERLISFLEYKQETEEEAQPLVEEKKEERVEEKVDKEIEIEKIAVEKKKERVSENSGYVLIAKYIASKGPVDKKFNILPSEMKNLITYVFENYTSIEEFMQNIKDFDNLEDDEVKFLNRKIKSFLALFYKLRTTTTEEEFFDFRSDLMEFVKNVIYYMAGIKKYEVLENIEKYKNNLTELSEKLKGIDERFRDYLSINISKSTASFESLIKYSIIFIILSIILVIIIF